MAGNTLDMKIARCKLFVFNKFDKHVTLNYKLNFLDQYLKKTQIKQKEKDQIPN